MCFNQPMSLIFGIMGLILTKIMWTKTNNKYKTLLVFYFTIMELLQYFQYFYIDQCDSSMNIFLTFLGYLHICFQPFILHLGNGYSDDKVIFEQNKIVIKLCFIVGLSLLTRFFISPWTNNFGCNTEWVRGEKLCTVSGKYHLAWSIPMYESTYFVPGVFIHNFFMIAPFFVLKNYSWIMGVLLFLTGPLLASIITENLQEQASIWCFFSIIQVGALFYGLPNKNLSKES
jgi:hypothetical protein